MSITVFSGTNLPPLVRVTNSADAPFRVSSNTAPDQPVRTLRIMNIRVQASRVAALQPPEPSTRITRVRRSKTKHR